ncbi:hypothetical protein [Rufibacter tibetensis]|uniref:hypothetical protein n=1 Tax=Rufibacter tibetensis TaxID=512763 RepID=UPI0012F7D946|nr:hypothetical protein [Rufibacter tibetensis]
MHAIQDCLHSPRQLFNGYAVGPTILEEVPMDCKCLKPGTYRVIGPTVFARWPSMGIWGKDLGIAGKGKPKGCSTIETSSIQLP